jgi:hypothetical protein
MADIFDELQEQPKKRTTFITVLCILTFIGSSYGLISGTYSYFTADKTARDAQNASAQFKSQKQLAEKNSKEKPGKNDKKGDAFAMSLMSNIADSFTAENIRKLSIADIIGAVLCLSGAFLMWRINKKGYILYVAGVLMGIIIPFLLLGNNFMGIMMSVVSGVIGLAFCILYAVNLKDMR